MKHSLTEHTWGGRFDYILPKAEIQAKIMAMNLDMATPWSFVRISMMVPSLNRKTIENAVKGTGAFSDRTQMLLSRFLQELMSGKLIVRYADPAARRYKWGTDHSAQCGPRPDPGLPEDHPDVVAFRKRMFEERKKRMHANRVIVERRDIPMHAVVRQLKVSIGGSGPKLQPTQKTVAAADMPAFADVVNVKAR